jgi:glycosyltransferase involved in cell wall biosynthesis
MLDVPLVYDSHELFLERNIGTRSRSRDKLVWAPVERFGIHACDAVFSVAEGICRHLGEQYGIPKPHLLRNVQPYEPPAEPSTLLADELGSPAGTPIVLYPGAITVNRGLEQMIDSAPFLDGAVYVIMGYARNADYLAGLTQRAEALGVLNRRVYFRDAVPIHDVVRYTASADLGIVPTQNICLSYFFESSNKIFHCLMAGVPLVMSDHAEKRLLAEEYGIGWLFDETDPREIAGAVNAALADRDAYRAAAQHCLRAARTLNWEHEEHRLRTVYAALLGDRVPPVPDVSLPSDTGQFPPITTVGAAGAVGAGS